jgi:hypothetical protein
LAIVSDCACRFREVVQRRQMMTVTVVDDLRAIPACMRHKDAISFGIIRAMIELRIGSTGYLNLSQHF